MKRVLAVLLVLLLVLGVASCVVSDRWVQVDYEEDSGDDGAAGSGGQRADAAHDGVDDPARNGSDASRDDVESDVSEDRIVTTGGGAGASGGGSGGGGGAGGTSGSGGVSGGGASGGGASGGSGGASDGGSSGGAAGNAGAGGNRGGASGGAGNPTGTGGAGRDGGGAGGGGAGGVGGAGTGGAAGAASDAGSEGGGPTKMLTEIGLSPLRARFARNNGMQFYATGMYEDGSSEDLTWDSLAFWDSSDHSVATANNTGTLKGWVDCVGTGSATISVMFGAFTGTATVECTAAMIIAIDITPWTPTIAPSAVLQLRATARYSDATTLDITRYAGWFTSDSSIAIVNNASEAIGQAQGVSPGTITVTASFGGVSGTTQLRVVQDTLVKVDIWPTAQIARSTNIQLNAMALYANVPPLDVTALAGWSSLNTAIVDVSNLPNRGIATGTGLGTTNVTATFQGVTGTTPATVIGSTLVSISVTPGVRTLAVGTTQPYVATGNFSDGTTQDLTQWATWRSENRTIADPGNAAQRKGLVSAEGVGTTNISAFLGLITGATQVNVTGATLSSITVTPGIPTRAAGTVLQFIATGMFSDATTQDLTGMVSWSSSNKAFAAISNIDGSRGLAGALSSGAAVISADLNGVNGQTTLTVTAATLTSLTISPSPVALIPGDTVQLNLTGTFSDGSSQNMTQSATWDSSDPASAYVSNAPGSRGVAMARSIGSGTITARVGTIAGSAPLSVTPLRVSSVSRAELERSEATPFSSQAVATSCHADPLTTHP